MYDDEANKIPFDEEDYNEWEKQLPTEKPTEADIKEAIEVLNEAGGFQIIRKITDYSDIIL